MTAYMKPSGNNIDQQLLKQKIFAQEGAGSPLGELAVPNAQMREVDRAIAGQEMAKQLQFGALGMKKTQQEHDIEMGKGQLDISRQGLNLAKDEFHFNLAMSRKADTVAKYGIALDLSFGIAGYLQQLQNSRKQETMLATLEARLAEIQRLRKAEEQA